MITLHVEINAPIEAVWADLRDISSHAEWMRDAASISFTSAKTEGVGATFNCLTKVGPIRLNDTMEVTEWNPPHEMRIAHKGLVKGEGSFVLHPAGAATQMTWQERLAFPWWLGGPLTQFFAQFVLKSIWRGNLRALAGRFDKPDIR